MALPIQKDRSSCTLERRIRKILKPNKKQIMMLNDYYYYKIIYINPFTMEYSILNLFIYLLI